MPVSRFESPLTGGHPNSLGNTVSVVDEVLADRALLAELVACYRSEDAVVRLRVSSAVKRVAQQQPEWASVQTYSKKRSDSCAKWVRSCRGSSAETSSRRR